jgi:hypothetical protein
MTDFNYFGRYLCGCLWGSATEPDEAEMDRLSKVTCRKCLAKMTANDRKAFHLSAFFKRNSMAEFYCDKQGQPPCLEQYTQVIEFEPDERENGHWSGLAAVGPSFRGKTVSCYHKLKLLAEDGFDCLAITSFDLNEIPNTLRLGQKAFKQLTDPWYEAEALLIDDLDKVHVTPAIATHLWNLFEHRLRVGSDGSLITLVSMNVTTDKAFTQLFSVNKGKANDITSTGTSLYNRFCEHLKFIKFPKAS